MAGITFPIHFPITVYKLLLGYRIGHSDLEIISPQLAKSIVAFSVMDEMTFNEMELTYSASLRYYEDGKSESKEFELLENGKDSRVLSISRFGYLEMLLALYLCARPLPAAQIKKGEGNHLILFFMLGVQDMCPRRIWNTLTPVDLQIAIEGLTEIDVNQWKQFSTIRGNFADGAITERLFWEVIESMDIPTRKKLLCFTIGTASLPPGGFESLNPRFTINIVATANEDTLPVAHTCFRSIDIPKYKTRQMMESKLLLAIEETSLTDMGNV
jgi:hypothetical protein